MVEHAREALGDRATILCQDLVELELPEPVDVVFSNATFHWIHDHDALFAALHAAIKPGGQLVAQCGGRGNIDAFRGSRTRSPARSRSRRTSTAGSGRGTTPAPRRRGAPGAGRVRRGRTAGSSPGRSRRPTHGRSCRRSASCATSTRCPRSCAVRSSTGCSAQAGSAARARVRAPEHDRPPLTLANPYRREAGTFTSESKRCSSVAAGSSVRPAVDLGRLDHRRRRSRRPSRSARTG